MRRIEIIALPVDDAREAEEGGAHRLELARGRESGGLTPPLALVEAVRSAVRTRLGSSRSTRPSTGLC